MESSGPGVSERGCSLLRVRVLLLCIPDLGGVLGGRRVGPGGLMEVTGGVSAPSLSTSSWTIVFKFA